MPKLVEDEKVYRAAIQSVIERGYAGATTKQIAQAADVSEVTLFRRYGNKARLVQRAIAAAAVEMDFETATRYTGDVAVDLLRVVQTYQDLAGRHGQFMVVILSELPRYPELADVLEIPLDVLDRVGQLLARYQAEGVLLSEHPLQAVTALLGPLMITNMIRGMSIEVPLPSLDLSNHVARFLEGRIQP